MLHYICHKKTPFLLQFLKIEKDKVGGKDNLIRVINSKRYKWLQKEGRGLSQAGNYDGSKSYVFHFNVSSTSSTLRRNHVITDIFLSAAHSMDQSESFVVTV